MNLKKSLAFSVSVFCTVASVYAADITGNSSGVFVNPQPANAVVTGLGTNVFTSGNGDANGPSSLTFSPTSFSTFYNSPFKLGTLSYFNGTTFGVDATSIDLATTLQFSGPAIPDVLSTFNFSLITTPNVGTPDQNADYVLFNNPTSLTTFVIDGTLYNVTINGFQNIIGDGFLASNSNEFHVREGSNASADLIGSVSLASTVPEPTTVALLGLGLFGFAASRRKSAKSKNV